MSRTYRRKNADKPSWVKRRWEYNDGVWDMKWFEGKELEQRLAYFHSDRYDGFTPSRFWRKVNHHEFRSKAKQELIKYYKNNDHEVQIRDNPRWPWWD